MTIDGLLEFFKGPLGGAMLWWILSSLVQALPEPDEKSTTFYRFLHNLAHILGANWTKVKA